MIPAAWAAKLGSPLVKYGVLALIALALVSWALVERSGRLGAKNKIIQLEGAVALRDSRITEQNRSILALSNATQAAHTIAAQLAKQRAVENAPIVAALSQLEKVIAAGQQEGKDCRDALREWRSGK